jgi:hypothetical protein
MRSTSRRRRHQAMLHFTGAVGPAASWPPGIDAFGDGALRLRQAADGQRLLVPDRGFRGACPASHGGQQRCVDGLRGRTLAEFACLLLRPGDRAGNWFRSRLAACLLTTFARHLGLHRSILWIQGSCVTTAAHRNANASSSPTASPASSATRHSPGAPSFSPTARRRATDHAILERRPGARTGLLGALQQPGYRQWMFSKTRMRSASSRKSRV